MRECSRSVFLDQSHGFLLFYKQRGVASEGKPSGWDCVMCTGEGSLGQRDFVFSHSTGVFSLWYCWTQVHGDNKWQEGCAQVVSFFSALLLQWECCEPQAGTLCKSTKPMWVAGWFPTHCQLPKRNTENYSTESSNDVQDLVPGNPMEQAGLTHGCWWLVLVARHDIVFPLLCPSGKTLNIITLWFTAIWEYACFPSHDCISTLHLCTVPHRSMTFSLQQIQKQVHVLKMGYWCLQYIPHGFVDCFAFVWVWSLSVIN